MVIAHEVGLGENLKLLPAEVRIAEENSKLAALSPIAQIPVLMDRDGSAFYDSRVIVDYLCHAAGNDSLLPLSGATRFRVLTLQAIGQGIADAAVGYRNEVAQRPAALHWHAWLDRQRRRIELSLDVLEAEWISEMTQITVGSLTTAVVLSYLDFRFADWRWQDGRPGLSAAHEKICSRRSMSLTKPGSA
jgi:glutathione S-transferase